MIPFASQRASGQDLATHLLNAHDNEQIDVASVRGAIARDLHGAFAEWEAIAHNLTRCRKYLYSLSINPDPGQKPLTREQYNDYIARVEAALGLSGQPRAVVFHVKDDRAHCHVVWSRIDLENEKAVHIAFDREKLMTVTRDFAHDHGLRLPAGYYRDSGDGDGGDDHHPDQLSHYEKAQEERTGLTREQRCEQITDAWRRSDSARAFVRALEELGYILATGKRPYVLVDRYGEINALPKLIDDKSVRTKDIRAFLESDFPPAALPSVEDARQRAAQQRPAHDDFDTVWDAETRRQEALAGLAEMQAGRRRPLEAEKAALLVDHAADIFRLESRQQDELCDLDAAFAAAEDELHRARPLYSLAGLAAVLARLPGIAVIVRSLQARADRKRRFARVKARRRLLHRHRRERAALDMRHKLERRTIAGRFRALRQVEKRERQSIARQALCVARVKARMKARAATRLIAEKDGPAFDPDIPNGFNDEPVDVWDAFDRAAHGADSKTGGIYSPLLGEDIHPEDDHDDDVDLVATFDRATGLYDGDDDDDGGDEGCAPDWRDEDRPSRRPKGPKWTGPSRPDDDSDR